MTANTRRPTVVGVFEDRPQADQAVAELRRAGFQDDQIGVAHQPSGRADTAVEQKVGQGPGAGVLTAVADFIKGLSGSEEAGRTIVRVRAEGRDDQALAVLRQHGGYNRETLDAAAVAEVASGAAARS